jgi:hypothetical protein
MKLLVFPGASLMEITPLDDGGLLVRCPGCGHEQVFRGTGERGFTHGERCPVFAKIDRAMHEVQRG